MVNDMTTTALTRQIRTLAIAAAIVAAGIVCEGGGAPASAQSAAAQPSLPKPVDDATGKPGSPLVDQIVRNDRPQLVVRRKTAQAQRRLGHHRVARLHVPRDLQRPALAGSELLAPLPLPGEPPHFVVPLPAYPLESVAAALTTPLPQIVCHPARREAGLPDAHLYREVPVACEPDNP